MLCTTTRSQHLTGQPPLFEVPTEVTTADELAKGVMPDCSPDDFGKEFRLGFDSEGYERRYLVGAVAECPTCGKDVALVSDTDSWIENDDGKWVHDSYGPDTGFCCGNLIVDSWDGCKVYELP